MRHGTNDQRLLVGLGGSCGKFLKNFLPSREKDCSQPLDCIGNFPELIKKGTLVQFSCKNNKNAAQLKN